jgi:hypothetical protein
VGPKLTEFPISSRRSGGGWICGPFLGKLQHIARAFLVHQGVKGGNPETGPGSPVKGLPASAKPSSMRASQFLKMLRTLFVLAAFEVKRMTSAQ